MGKAALRQHVGAGKLAAPRELSVFVNCPYDPAFRPVFEAIVFSCICCGFIPRTAMETASSAVPRMTRITRALMASKYSIHDLSRCCGEGDENLARFNMPLELGIAMAERERNGDLEGSHDWLLLVPDGHCYRRFISDLAGYDPTDYDGQAEGAVPAVMAWLATRVDAVKAPMPAEVRSALPAFSSALARLDDAWCGRLPWSDMLLAAIETAEGEGLVHAIDT